MKFGIGQSVKRIEDNKFLIGAASYTDDLNFDDQAYMYILRSPCASAKIAKINLEKTKK